MIRARRASILAASAGIAVVVWACGRNPLDPLSLNNAPPEVRILAAPAVAAGANAARQVRWEASDPDGRIDHYLVAVAPSTQRGEPTWTRIEQSMLLVPVATESTTKRARGLRPVEEPAFTLVSVRAVDDRGAMSEPAQLAIFGANLPPYVQITSPPFSNVNIPIVSTTPRIRWQGKDPDGLTTQVPVEYRYRVFDDGPAPSDFPFPVLEPSFVDFIRANPDSLRRGYAPLFPGWTSVGPDTHDVRLQGLTPDHSYYFAITGFDEAGDYDPIFNVNKNLMRMQVGYDDQARPRITALINGSPRLIPPGTIDDPPPAWALELPEDYAPLTIGWRATASAGETIVKTRFAFLPDGATAPTNGEWMHWLGQHSRVLPMQFGGTARVVYIEVEDSAGLSSLAVIHLYWVSATAVHPLLIVNDTRFQLDQRGPTGSMLPPAGAWPMAAELDTFLFAVGGFQWQSYPAGTVTTPGLFTGYQFDTIGTHRLQNLDLPLQSLMRYQHVIWIVDADAATNDETGLGSNRRMTALRYMTGPNGSNALAKYVEAGGSLWLVGGGAARATLLDWQRPGGGSDFCSSDGELVPGRMMYDQMRWRSCLNVSSGGGAVSLTKSPRALGQWLGPLGYGLFPDEISRASLAPADPVPPLRTPGQFYRPSFWYEFLTTPNAILERVEGGSPVVLDTLYQASGGSIPASSVRPTMTLYHAQGRPIVIFTGFDLWSFHRTECREIVQAVLDHLWDVPLRPAPVTASNVSAGDPASSAAPTSPLASRRR